MSFEIYIQRRSKTEMKCRIKLGIKFVAKIDTLDVNELIISKRRSSAFKRDETRTLYTFLCVNDQIRHSINLKNQTREATVERLEIHGNDVDDVSFCDFRRDIFRAQGTAVIRGEGNKTYTGVTQH